MNVGALSKGKEPLALTPSSLTLSVLALGHTEEMMKSIKNAILRSRDLPQSDWVNLQRSLKLLALQEEDFNWVTHVVVDWLRPWIDSATRATIYSFGALLGDFLSFLLDPERPYTSHFPEVLQLSLDCAHDFENRICGQLLSGTPEQFYRRLFHPICHSLSTFDSLPSQTHSFFDRLEHLWQKYHLPFDFCPSLANLRGRVL